MSISEEMSFHLVCMSPRVTVFQVLETDTYNESLEEEKLTQHIRLTHVEVLLCFALYMTQIHMVSLQLYTMMVFINLSNISMVSMDL